MVSKTSLAHLESCAVEAVRSVFTNMSHWRTGFRPDVSLVPGYTSSSKTVANVEGRVGVPLSHQLDGTKNK